MFRTLKFALVAALTFSAVAPAPVSAITPGQRIMLWAKKVKTVFSFGPINPVSTALGLGSAGVFDSGNAEGWTVTCPTCTAGQTFTVARQGYDATGTATSYTDTFTVTNKLRQAYSSAGYISGGAVLAQTAWPINANNLWALSDYVLSTDTPAGFTNNSTLISPKPVGNWIEYDHQIIQSNTLHAAATFFSRTPRNGRSIAAVIYTASDGTNSASCTSATMAVSTRNAGDQNKVLSYECDINVSSLNDNSMITLNGVAYPWIGGTGSVLDSNSLAPTGTGATLAASARYFSPRYYLKNTTKAGSPWKAWVCPVVNAGGSCPVGAAGIANGTWSKTAATAAAAPFLTVEDAINRAPFGITADNGGVGLANGAGYLDGAIIYVAGTAVCCGTSFYHPNQAVAAVTVTNDPATTATYQTGTGSGPNWLIGDISFNTRTGGSANITAPTRESAIVFKGVNIKRGSSNVPAQTSSTQLSVTGQITSTTLTLSTALPQTVTIVSGTQITGTGVTAGSTVSGTSTTTFTVSPSQTVAAGTVFTVSDHNNVSVILDNVTLDCNTFVGNTIGTTANLYAFGTTANNCPASSFFYGSNTRMLRGVLATAATSSSGGSFDQSLLLGFKLTNPTIGGLTPANDNRSIVAFGQRLANSTAFSVCSTVNVPDGLAYVQNVTEGIAATGNYYGEVWGGDAGNTASCANVLIQYNTMAGAAQFGRQFIGYDQNPGNPRVYKFWSLYANIVTEVVAKKDIFDGFNQADAATGTAAAANRTGAWANDNGVGWVGNLSMYNPQAAFPGFSNYKYGQNALNTAVTASEYTRLDPVFVLDGGKITSVSAGGSYTAGAGGADLHLQAGSPCKANVPVAGLPFTIDGVARPTTNDSCGAY